MRCDPVYGPGNVKTGFLCGRSRGGGPKLPPCACGQPGVYECDGPPPPGARRKTCDRPMCARCAVSIRAFDLDFCWDCALAVAPLDCLLVGFGPELVGRRCLGARVAKVDLCLRHAVLFDHWLAFAGGSKVYANQEMDREAKRAVHRRWLGHLQIGEAAHILEGRHAPTT